MPRGCPGECLGPVFLGLGAGDKGAVLARDTDIETRRRPGGGSGQLWGT